MRKHFLFFIIFSGILFLTGCSSNSSPFSTSSPSSHISTTPVSTTTLNQNNWITYKNTDYGFELQYPPDWQVTSSFPGRFTDKLPQTDPQIFDFHGPEQQLLSLYIAPSGWQCPPKQGDASNINGQDSKITIDGVEGIVREGTTTEYMKPAGRAVKEIYFCKSDTYFRFTISKQENNQIADTIVSSFKFIKVDKLVQNNNQEKRPSSCDEEMRSKKDREETLVDENTLWISSEYYSGMHHAPTIRHVCRGHNELFYLQMDWNDKAITHTGALIAIHSSSTFRISSKNVDPEFELLQDKNNQHLKQVWVSVDGKTVVFDEVNNMFSNSIR